MFGHDFRDSGTAVVAVDNARVDTRLELRFDTETLPALHQWKMSGEGHYVMGARAGQRQHLRRPRGKRAPRARCR